MEGMKANFTYRHCWNELAAYVAHTQFSNCLVEPCSGMFADLLFSVVAGVLANILNITLHHGGYLWLKHGGRTPDEEESHYNIEVYNVFDFWNCKKIRLIEVTKFS
jgi:hypothetical protein